MQLRIFHSNLVLPFLAAVFQCGLPSVSVADTVLLGASKDNTLINNSEGSFSNGAGSLFAGLTGNAGPGALRVVLAFDSVSDIPVGSVITDVELTLNVLQAGPGSGSDSFSLHRLEQDWGEGTSSSSGGAGVASTPGDATWIHTFFESSTWANPGGDFHSTPSAVEIIVGTGPVSWDTTSELVADVQNWVNNPGTNFGWILIGDESADKSAREFNSRDFSSNAPQLSVTFTPIPEPHSLALAMLGSLGGLLLYPRRQR